MCRAGRRGFVSPISRVDLQDGDEAVRQESRTGRPLKTPAAPAMTKTTHLLRLVSARTRESRGGKSPRKQWMALGLQKGRRKASCVLHGVHEPDDRGTHHQLDSESLRRDDGIQQGVTDADTEVIGHGRQRKPSAAVKNPKHPCCQAQPRKEMAFLLTKKSESILGLTTCPRKTSDWGKSTWAHEGGNPSMSE